MHIWINKLKKKEKQQDIYSFKNISPQIVVNNKNENTDFIVQKNSRYLLNQLIKLVSQKQDKAVFCGITTRNV
jgi:hypothetical protein